MNIGIVEDNIDPKQEGRVRVRVYGQTDQRNGDGKYIIPVDMLPWAVCGSICAGGAFSVPKIGEEVIVSGDIINAPVWTHMEKLSPEVGTELGDDRNAHVLLYDTDFDNGSGEKLREGEFVKIYFKDNRGLVIEYRSGNGYSTAVMDNNGGITLTDGSGSSVAMQNGSITITAGNSITLDAPQVNIGENASEGVLKSESFKKLFENHRHMCNESGSLSETPFGGMPLSDCANLCVQV